MEPIRELECTITGPEGQGYTAMGAVFDPETGGYLYVAGDPAHHLSGQLQTWHGERVGYWQRVSTWRRYGARWGESYTMVALRGYVSGREYTGRFGCDWSQLIHLKPLRGGG